MPRPAPARIVRRGLVIAVLVVLVVAGAVAFRGTRDHSRPAATPAAATPAVPPGSSEAVPELTTGELLPTSVPTRVAIPALDVDVPVIGLGLQADGTMQVPGDARTVGWFTKAPTPGSLGPAVLAGHVDYRGAAGTFAHLTRLRPGAEIRVTREDGRTAVFAVTASDRYPKDRFPSDAVYGPIDHAGLRLITCGGDFDTGTGHYTDNVVVYAALRGTR
ncbi:class F sortase [Actinoplanes sp. DH11]|uniref:class F sortase n=1 Tax=Actinoplanes sp. DH11 TaxID=2857011 RepID=UPI001E42CF7F|nr:class F sortase [Actinoplanes sp. DH11]